MSLPFPDSIALQFSEKLRVQIVRAVQAAGGWLSFADYMALALYMPGLGYYSGGAQKFGVAGDFVTAPELSPIFAQTLAPQVAQIMRCSKPFILEAGAGSGLLAAELLLELQKQDALPQQYFILELSGELRQRQHSILTQHVPHLVQQVSWLDALPSHYDGVILANEVLDAMPAHLVVWNEAGIAERGVELDESGAFHWADRPATGAVLAAAQALPVRVLPSPCSFCLPYISEINLLARAWVAQWGSILGQGALLLIDYGFPAHEYYHPQRDMGTLMCHYRHHSHTDPFYLPGLNDITAHVDFSAIAAAGHASGLTLLGYANQAQFLLNCGLTDILARQSFEDSVAAFRLSSVAQKLISPAEMGELFKIIAIGRDMDEPLMGFTQGDRGHTL